MYFRLQEADYLVSEQNNQENRSNLKKNYFLMNSPSIIGKYQIKKGLCRNGIGPEVRQICQGLCANCQLCPCLRCRFWFRCRSIQSYIVNEYLARTACNRHVASGTETNRYAVNVGQVYALI